MDAYEKLEKIGEGTYGKVGGRIEEERRKKERKMSASFRRRRRPSRELPFSLALSFFPPQPHSFDSSLIQPHSLTPLQVYKAKEKSTGRLVALKKTRLEVSKKEEGDSIRPESVDSSLCCPSRALGPTLPVATVAAAAREN